MKLQPSLGATAAASTNELQMPKEVDRIEGSSRMVPLMVVSPETIVTRERHLRIGPAVVGTEKASVVVPSCRPSTISPCSW